MMWIQSRFQFEKSGIVGALRNLIVTKTQWTKACSTAAAAALAPLAVHVARRVGGGGGSSERFESGEKCCVLRAGSLHKYPKMLLVRSTFRVPAFRLRARALSTLMSDDFGAQARVFQLRGGIAI
jgi:hypothetical protein